MHRAFSLTSAFIGTGKNRIASKYLIMFFYSKTRGFIFDLFNVIRVCVEIKYTGEAE